MKDDGTKVFSAAVAIPYLDDLVGKWFGRCTAGDEPKKFRDYSTMGEEGFRGKKKQDWLELRRIIWGGSGEGESQCDGANIEYVPIPVLDQLI